MISHEAIKSQVHGIDIKTERLQLRLFTEADRANEFKQQQDPEVMKYIRPPQTDEQVNEYMVKLLTPYEVVEGEWQGFCVERQSDGQSIGGISFRFESIDSEIVEIGYRFDPAFYGQGYATEAIKALVHWLFSNLKVHKVVAKCDPENTASYRIMEKLGMQQEALLRQHYKLGDIYTDEVVCGLLASEYHR